MHIFNIFLIQNWFSKEQIVIHAISCPCFTIIPFISCVWRYFMRIKLAKTGCCWLICLGMSGSYDIFLNDLIWWLTFIVTREKLKEKSRNKDIISSSSGRVWPTNLRFSSLVYFRFRLTKSYSKPKFLGGHVGLSSRVRFGRSTCVHPFLQSPNYSTM